MVHCSLITTPIPILDSGVSISSQAVTSFVKDGKIITLKEMGIDRITRKELFSEINEIGEIKEDSSGKNVM
jgi:hypothetical protein